MQPLVRRLSVLPLLAAITVISLALRAGAQPPGGPPGDFQMPPEMKKMMEGMKKWADAHKNTMSLQRTIQGIGELDKDPATKVTKAQAGENPADSHDMAHQKDHDRRAGPDGQSGHQRNAERQTDQKNGDHERLWSRDGRAGRRHGRASGHGWPSRYGQRAWSRHGRATGNGQRSRRGRNAQTP